MSEDRVVVRELDRPGDLGWVLAAHGELYAKEYGWEIERVTARILADYAETARPGRDAAWIAELDGQRVGCVFCVWAGDAAQRSSTIETAPEVSKLRLLLVDPAARGHRLGTRLVERCLSFARDAGYARMVLWTNEPLAAARRIYLAAGFTLVGEEVHEEFGVPLLGQEYAREL